MEYLPTVAERMKTVYDNGHLSQWKDKSDAQLGQAWFEGVYNLFCKEEIIPPVSKMRRKGFSLIDFSANKGTLPVYLAARLQKNLAAAGVADTNRVKIYLNDLVERLVRQTESELLEGSFTLFGRQYGQNPLLHFTSEDANKPNFEAGSFDIILDLKGALWHSAELFGFKDSQPVGKILENYYRLLSKKGRLILDGYTVRDEQTSLEVATTFDAWVDYAEGKDLLAEIKQTGSVVVGKDRFEVQLLEGSGEKLRFYVLQKHYQPFWCLGKFF